MDRDVYEQLAAKLDKLPGGFPRTAGGAEMRILRRLFAPEEAELALHLTLLAEEPRVIAYRAGLPVEEATRRLEEMDAKGLLYSIQRPGQPRRYQAQQFIVGIWENQVNRLNPELIRDFEEYLEAGLSPERWRQVPQLRTIPVAESIPVQVEVMAYEQAEKLVRSHRAIAVANCICRQEMRLLGNGCDKPEETCLVFGQAARHYIHTGRGRSIDQAEALSILRRAADAALVLQPGNSEEPLNICACCGCCCGVLRSLKRDPRPASLVASPFHASLNTATCEGCGLCVDRCQMEALALDGGHAVLDLDRCIGCGLCVSTCPTGSLTLVRKPAAEQPAVPKDTVRAWIQWMQARGTADLGELAGMVMRSRVDRLRAR